MVAVPEGNERWSCAVYSLTGDPDFLMFDAGLWDVREHVNVSECSAVALVRLRPGSVELVLDRDSDSYRLATDTGRYDALQVVCGEAGEEVLVIGFRPDRGLAPDEEEDEEGDDEEDTSPQIVGAGDCETCSRDDVELYEWGELNLCFDCVLLAQGGRWL